MSPTTFIRGTLTQALICNLQERPRRSVAWMCVAAIPVMFGQISLEDSTKVALDWLGNIPRSVLSSERAEEEIQAPPRR
jgi:hypothetical protein